MTSEISALFERLGQPDGIGRAFAITRRCFLEEFGGDQDRLLAAMPAADWPHIVSLDRFTENYIVTRPGADGVYLIHGDVVREVR